MSNLTNKCWVAVYKPPADFVPFAPGPAGFLVNTRQPCGKPAKAYKVTYKDGNGQMVEMCPDHYKEIKADKECKSVRRVNDE